jgi:hypothetical protein
MEFPAIDNEDHKVVLQHMHCLLLLLLSNHFYLIQLMEATEYHSSNYFQDNKPEINSIKLSKVFEIAKKFGTYVHLYFDP